MALNFSRLALFHFVTCVASVFSNGPKCRSSIVDPLRRSAVQLHVKKKRTSQTWRIREALEILCHPVLDAQSRPWIGTSGTIWGGNVLACDLVSCFSLCAYLFHSLFFLSLYLFFRESIFLQGGSICLFQKKAISKKQIITMM